MPLPAQHFSHSLPGQAQETLPEKRTLHLAHARFGVSFQDFLYYLGGGFNLGTLRPRPPATGWLQTRKTASLISGRPVRNGAAPHIIELTDFSDREPF